MTRSLVIGGIGVALLATALAWTFLYGDGEAPPAAGPAARAPKVIVPPAAPPLAERAAPEAATPGAAPKGPAAKAPAKPAGPERAAKAPSFDVVRIKPNGDAVIAGRAEPGATVGILDGGRLIGEIVADTRGEWVYLPGQPLPAGARELGLTARNPDGSSGQSESVVVLYVPERDKEKTEAVVASPAPARPESAPARTETAAAPPPAPAPPAAPTAPAPTAPAPTPPAPTAQQAPAAEAAAPPSPAPAQPVIAIATPRDGGPSKVLQAPPRAPESSSIAVEVVDYDDGGELMLSGRARPGAGVVVYLDNDAIGRTAADKEGRWEMQPERPVDPGQYRLRADELSAQGRVVARVELPFARSRIERAPGQEGVGRVVVQPGNSLWRIARHHYGAGTRYTVLYQANKDQIRDPDLIYPGQIFALPPVN